MKLIIHRGTNEIGGSCVEITGYDARILIDTKFYHETTIYSLKRFSFIKLSLIAVSAWAGTVGAVAVKDFLF